jgi:hypothetical protein
MCRNAGPSSMPAASSQARRVRTGHVCGSVPYRSSTPGAFVFGPQRRNEEDTGRRAHLVEVGRNGCAGSKPASKASVEVGEALRGRLIAAIGLALAGAAVLGGTLPAHASPNTRRHRQAAAAGRVLAVVSIVIIPYAFAEPTGGPRGQYRLAAQLTRAAPSCLPTGGVPVGRRH